MDQHLEIEAKYDLAAEADLPDLTEVEGVDAVRQQPAVTLTATYYDTADHALLRRGVTLRRREGGADEGWHLKVKVARGERLELRRPLGRDAVPPTALTDLLTVLAPTAQLRPVATLVTHRTVLNLVGGDVVLAEVADDVVTATRDVAGAGGVAKDGERTIWREVEVELVDGDRAVLNRVDKLLRREGLHPSASTSKVGRVLAPDAPPDAPVGSGTQVRGVGGGPRQPPAGHRGAAGRRPDAPAGPTRRSRSSGGHAAAEPHAAGPRAQPPGLGRHPAGGA